MKTRKEGEKRSLWMILVTFPNCTMCKRRSTKKQKGLQEVIRVSRILDDDTPANHRPASNRTNNKLKRRGREISVIFCGRKRRHQFKRSKMWNQAEISREADRARGIHPDKKECAENLNQYVIGVFLNPYGIGGSLHHRWERAEGGKVMGRQWENRVP